MCGCAQSFDFDPDFSDDGEFEFGISNPGSPYYPDYDPNFIANSPEEDDADLARRWSEEHPVAASSSAANAMFSEYLKVVRAKRAGTFVSYEDAKQDEPR